MQGIDQYYISVVIISIINIVINIDPLEEYNPNARYPSILHPHCHLFHHQHRHQHRSLGVVQSWYKVSINSWYYISIIVISIINIVIIVVVNIVIIIIKLIVSTSIISAEKETSTIDVRLLHLDTSWSYLDSIWFLMVSIWAFGSLHLTTILSVWWSVSCAVLLLLKIKHDT